MELKILLIFFSVFLALNMGSSGFSVSFAPSFGSGLLDRKKSSFFYFIFLTLGGVLIGWRVVETLTRKISNIVLTTESAAIIVFVCTVMMLLSNILKVPQSTSFVTVAAFTGASVHYKSVNFYTILKILLAAIVFSLISFVLTFFIKKILYPPRNSNFRFYEKLVYHQDKLKKFIIYTDCYSAFAVGSNNLANVVAPLMLTFNINVFLGLLIVGIFFGLGSVMLGERLLKTVSKDIIPLGQISASVVSLSASTCAILASILGLPTPYVQFTVFSILAISSVKEGFYFTYKHNIVRRIVYVWLLVPLFTFLLSYILHYLLL